VNAVRHWILVLAVAAALAGGLAGWQTYADRLGRAECERSALVAQVRSLGAEPVTAGAEGTPTPCTQATASR
jgi:hypothetical protein